MSDRDAARLACLAFAVVVVAGVLLRPAMPIDETRYLAVAWEMWLSKDWLVPTRNFEIYSHKPPLLFWAINAVWWFTGVSEVAARLVGPAFAVLAIVLTGRLARTLWPDDAEAGPRAVIALCGLLLFAVFGGLTMFDAALTAATAGATLALVRAVATGRWRDWALLGFAVAAGVLAKGPVILLHVVPALVLVPVWAGGGTARAPGRRVVAGGAACALAVALAVVGLWLVPAVVAGGPDYRDAVLWTQSAGRMSASFAHAKPLWFYAVALPVLLFPWLWVPGLWRAAGRQGIWREPGLRLCLVWFGAALLLFSLISGKQVHYLLPGLGAAALVVARLSRNARDGLWVAAIPVLGLAAAGFAAAAGFVSLGDAGNLIHPRSILVAWVMLLLGIAWLAIRLGGLRGGAVLSLGLLLSVDLAVGLTDTRGIYDTHGIAAIVAPHAAAGLAFYGQTYHAEFNFAGRLRQPVANPMSAAALRDWAAAHPGGRIVARPDRSAPGWPPREIVLFRNAPYGIWTVADAPLAEPGA
ncbi:glycosyltransferase family 39 protein [uncultured Jannaschia sp.]|uniref:ArnT family glycosyltransferase n=1 Tax=uncultured Jannaschia sp. TaxID=293347 RepID=UPI00261CF0A1|nr:glycosyltransferase family 39 protein [uncultured Jannaschia sp.]